MDLLCRNCGGMVHVEDMEEHARVCQPVRADLSPDKRIIQFANTLEERIADWSEEEVERGLEMLRMARAVAALQPDGTLGPADKCKELVEGLAAHECCRDEAVQSWAQRIGYVAADKHRWLRSVKTGAPTPPRVSGPISGKLLGGGLSASRTLNSSSPSARGPTARCSSPAKWARWTSSPSR